MAIMPAIDLLSLTDTELNLVIATFECECEWDGDDCVFCVAQNTADERKREEESRLPGSLPRMNSFGATGISFRYRDVIELKAGDMLRDYDAPGHVALHYVEVMSVAVDTEKVTIEYRRSNSTEPLRSASYALDDSIDSVVRYTTYPPEES